ncbi:hypothetical protein PSN_2051 [Pseudomonas sp. NGC7]
MSIAANRTKAVNVCRREIDPTGSSGDIDLTVGQIRFE